MSGHSKWATTKHKKAVVDAKRGKMFAKLIKNIEVAARTGGGDPARQPDAVRRDPEGQEVLGPQRQHRPRGQARGRAPKAGGADYQTIMYEGYGPNGVAVLIECLTDNRNRAAGEVRIAMTRNGGTMADPGSVSYLFTRKGVVIVPKERHRPRTTCSARCSTPAPRRSTTSATPSRSSARPPTWSRSARRCRRPASTTTRPTPSSCPSMAVELDEDGARKIFRLIDALEDSDDVQNVCANFDVSDEVMAAVELDGRDDWPPSTSGRDRTGRRRRLRESGVAAVD